ncbi:MAG: class I SAM-dependent methyltransferase [Flavobacteriaceae bacterium]|nr:class I SAM-dependent methyltransferase [Flavobacteriaceae bacterium]
MNKNILHTEVQGFINENLNNDISKLLFKGSPFDNITIQELVEQIESKYKAKSKLPTFYKTSNIYYPNKLNIEQTSSEITAEYKANLISGNSIIDLTGGFGVDTYYFSKRFKEVTHCEINKDLSEIVAHNFQVLNVDNTSIIPEDGLKHLQTQQQQYDWIYIDPSRRNDVKGKVFLLEDCLPNVPENLDPLFEFTDNILIKASPILDITSAINELNFVKEVHAVAIQNEVKELLFILKKAYKGSISVKTVNIANDTEQTFESEFKKNAKANFSEPLTYLYEPNSTILKAGLFNEVSHQLKLSKLNVNSHLYTSIDLINFPGRRFKIIQILPYHLKKIKKEFSISKGNITVRNFPETVAQIRKKTKLKDGGDSYLFFTTDLNNKHIVLVCEKV